MKGLLLVSFGLAVYALMLPAVSVSSHGKDSVRASDNSEPIGCGSFNVHWQIEARGGPNGESPVGMLRQSTPTTTRSFAVTCLAVNGPRAIVGGQDGAEAVIAFVRGQEGAEPGRVLVESISPPVSCSTTFRESENRANAVVHDS